MKGYRVRYTLATKLVNELVEAADEKQLEKQDHRPLRARRPPLHRRARLCATRR
jgi:hypothetical protein